MVVRMIMADFKTAKGWAHNSYNIFDPDGNIQDEDIVFQIEKMMCCDGFVNAKCVAFMEIYGDILTAEEILKIQEGKTENGLLGRVTRFVIVNDDLYKEWIKPEGVAQ